jgi:hypothetical protein
MDRQDPLLDAHLRAARYWNVDGLTDIAIGVWVLLVALCQYGIALTSRGSMGRMVFVLIFAFGLPAALFFTNRLVVGIRRRFTYRRTGFVAYRRDRRAWAFGAVLAVAMALTLLVLRKTGANWAVYLFALQGLIPGGALMYFGHLVRVARFQVVGAIYAGAGVAVALANPGLVPGMILFWTAMGSVHLFGGVVTLWQYVRLHPNVAKVQ